jgi:hypothetical protein
VTFIYGSPGGNKVGTLGCCAHAVSFKNDTFSGRRVPRFVWRAKPDWLLGRMEFFWFVIFWSVYSSYGSSYQLPTASSNMASELDRLICCESYEDFQILCQTKPPDDSGTMSGHWDTPPPLYSFPTSRVALREMGRSIGVFRLPDFAPKEET